jgi:hypothetical protein
MPGRGVFGRPFLYEYKQHPLGVRLLRGPQQQIFKIRNEHQASVPLDEDWYREAVGAPCAKLLWEPMTVTRL